MRTQSFRSAGLLGGSCKSKPVCVAASATVEMLEHRTLLSTTLTPIADTFVRDNNYSLTNFGASPILFVKDASNGDDRVAFLKFNLSGISTINSAILNLSGALQTSTATPAATGVFAVPDSTWAQGNGTIVDSVGDGFDTNPVPANAMTWNNMPAISGSPLATATVTDSTFQTYTFDVTSYLQQQLAAGNTTISLALENLQPTDQQSEFLSSKSTSTAGSTPQLVIDDGSPTAPTANIAAAPVTAASNPASEQVTVTYSGNAAINASTIASSNISVTPYAGGSALNVESTVGTTQNGDGSITAVYTVDAPGGSWNSADNGAYAIAVQANSVADVNGLGVTAAHGSFNVNVGDTIPPTASISAPAVSTAGGGTYVFTVTYTDNVAVNASSITLANVSVSGQAGPLNVTSMTLSPSGNASQIVATYTATAPNGAWAASDNGQYTVTLSPNQVLDTAGNAAATTSQNFAVAIPVPDTTPPTVASITAPPVTAPGGATETVTVVYTDNVAVQASTINTSDIVVASPSGSDLAVTGVTTTGSGASITAVYTIAAPGGAWSASANGTYSISVVPGSVTDTSGNPVAASSASFNVSAAVADTQPPAAAISAPAITTANGATETVSVTYTDNVAINTSSIGLGNLSVSGPAGPLTITNFAVSGTGPFVTATYTVQAPGDSWDAADDGTYTIALNANQVRDTSGNAAPVTFGSFAVNIALPNPSDPTFNSGNPVIYPFVAQATATQANGQIIVVGYEATSPTTNEGVIERLNVDGTVDTTFGNKGQIVTSINNDQWFALVMQGANHFVVAGTDNGDFALARYDFSGNLDPTFGSGGLELTDFGSASDTAYSLALSPTGQIVAGGTSNNRFAFARYDANGNLDSSFGEGGRQLIDTGAATQVIGAVAVQNDGQIVGAGSSGSNVEVIRLTAGGDPDANFNSDGVVVVAGLTANGSTSSLDYTVGLGLQSDGKIVVAGQTSSGHFGIVRLTTDGSLDSSFGVGGMATANFGGEDEADSVVIQSNGDIIAVGTSLVSAQPLTAVAAFNANGTLINSFGENGMATFSTGTASPARELHIGQLVLRAFGGQTADGEVVVGTSSSGGSQTVFSSLRRILVPGSTTEPAIQEIGLGNFGLITGANGKKHRQNAGITLGSGRSVIFSLSGSGTGTILQAGNNIHVEVTASAGETLTIRVIGGGTVNLSNIDVTGSLSAIHAIGAVVNGDITATGSLGTVLVGSLIGNVTVTGSLGALTTGNVGGTISVGGNLGRLKAGTISGKVIVNGNIVSLTTGDVSGEIYSGGAIHNAKVGNVTGLIDAATLLNNLTALSLSDATILAGANLPNGVLDVAGSTDTFAAGSIGTLRVSGVISSSFVGAGVNPNGDAFGNGNDTAAGTGLIKSIVAKGGADAATHFEAGVFGTARLPGKVVVTTDPRFIVL